MQVGAVGGTSTAEPLYCFLLSRSCTSCWRGDSHEDLKDARCFWSCLSKFLSLRNMDKFFTIVRKDISIDIARLCSLDRVAWRCCFTPFVLYSYIFISYRLTSIVGRECVLVDMIVLVLILNIFLCMPFLKQCVSGHFLLNCLILPLSHAMYFSMLYQYDIFCHKMSETEGFLFYISWHICIALMLW